MTVETTQNHRPAERGEPQYAAMIAPLVEWVAAADAAYQVATRLVATSFVPAQFRGKPEEGAAAILAGAEVGLSPMASLKAFDVIQGVATPRAMTLRAILQSIGHEVVLVESTDDRAVVRGRRKGSSDWQTVEWTLDRARGLQLLAKDNWKKQPGAMLVARATAECCRLIASDAILGMPYSTEEADEGFDQLATTVQRANPAPARPSGLRARAAEARELVQGTVEPEPAPEPVPLVEELRAVADAARPTPEEPVVDVPDRIGSPRAHELDPEGMQQWEPDDEPPAEPAAPPAEETPRERALRVGREARERATGGNA